MSRRPAFHVSMIALLALALPLGYAHAFTDGPPDGVAGEPPDNLDCTLCHGSFPLNSGDGSLVLLGAPDMIVPDVTYDLIVRIEDPGQEKWGYELTVLDENDQSSGTLIVVDANSQLSDNPAPDPDYLKHTSDGTRPGTLDGPVDFEFQWTAGEQTLVTFYVAGNAANDGSGSNGDYIYTITQTVGAQVGVSDLFVASPHAAVLAQNHPNPFNPTTDIAFQLVRDANVQLRILDASGRSVRVLVDGFTVAGDYSVSWDGRDGQGSSLSSGVYFYRLSTPEFEETRKMVLMK